MDLNLDDFLKEFSTCPNCGRNNEVMALTNFYYNKNKVELKKQLLDSLDLKLKIKNSIKIGIPCCHCLNLLGPEAYNNETEEEAEELFRSIFNENSTNNQDCSLGDQKSLKERPKQQLEEGVDLRVYYDEFLRVANNILDADKSHFYDDLAPIFADWVQFRKKIKFSCNSFGNIFVELGKFDIRNYDTVGTFLSEFIEYENYLAYYEDLLIQSEAVRIFLVSVVSKTISQLKRGNSGEFARFLNVISVILKESYLRTFSNPVVLRSELEVLFYRYMRGLRVRLIEGLKGLNAKEFFEKGMSLYSSFCPSFNAECLKISDALKRIIIDNVDKFFAELLSSNE